MSPVTIKREVSWGTILVLVSFAVGAITTWVSFTTMAQQNKVAIHEHEEEKCHEDACDQLKEHELEIRILKKDLKDIKGDVDAANEKLDDLVDHLLPRRPFRPEEQ